LYFAEVLSTSPPSSDLYDPEIRRKLFEMLFDHEDFNTEEFKQFLSRMRSRFCVYSRIAANNVGTNTSTMSCVF
jgi:hypothetical protein